MTNCLLIKGKNPLSGTIDVMGSKNAALPILAATILTKKKCRIGNLPLVLDVHRMLEMLEQMGSVVRWRDKKTVEIENKDISPRKLRDDTVKTMRASILFLGPLLARFGKLENMQYPGGCSIGVRPIDTHLQAFRDLGAEINLGKKYFSVNISKHSNISRKVVLGEFSVTATENIMMFLARAPAKSQIRIAASEPHVRDLARFLSKMGVVIRGAGTATISIAGRKELNGASHRIIADYIEAGTFIIASIISGRKVVVNNFCVSDLDFFINKLVSWGVNIKILPGKNAVEVRGMFFSSPRNKRIAIDKIQVLPHPGLPTDLQSILGVLASQAHLPTLIHESLYEKRLEYLKELKKMGVNSKILDCHRAIIEGPQELRGGKVTARDLRGGAALIVAGLAACGTTTIRDIKHVDRGYENFDGRLRELGADIKRIP